jgi:hypothetical protein
VWAYGLSIKRRRRISVLSREWNMQENKIFKGRISQILVPVLSIVSLEHNIGNHDCQGKALFLFTVLYINSLE